MANSAVSSAPRNGVSLRKTNKPLMEKRRRARINDSLTQLKSLVIHSSKKDSSQFSKLEKADILELTVRHLRGLQQQQQQQQQGNGSTDSNNANSIGNKYRAGFVECANEVIRYLDQSQGFNTDTKTKVISHLAQCLQLVSHVQQPKPAVNIPSHPSSSSSTASTIPVGHIQINGQAPITASVHPAGSIPIQTSSSTAVPQTATTILSTGTTTTQLPNGQIIQIVTNPIQNLQQTARVSTGAAVSVSANNIVGFKQPVSSFQAFPLSHSSSSLSSSVPVSNPTLQSNNSNVMTSNPTPIAPQPAYVNYTQPLHIQIPPLVSPVLIQHPQAVKMAPTVAKETVMSHYGNNHHSNNNNSSIKNSTSADEIVSSSTHMVISPVPAPTSSSSSLSSSSSPAPHPSLPKVKAQKQLNFYSSEEIKDELLSRSRSYSMTSSASSSSENEMSSPLNLSQSPPYLSQKYDHHSHHQHNRHQQQHQQQQHHNRLNSSSTRPQVLSEHYLVNQPLPLKTQDDNNNNIILNKSSLQQHQQQQQQKFHHNNTNCNNQAYHLYGKPMDNAHIYQDRNTISNYINSHNNNSNGSFNSSNSTNSVIVNTSRKYSGEFPEAKYFSMMDHEDRHCLTHHSTPSPASSMGEERLWRPW